MYEVHSYKGLWLVIDADGREVAAFQTYYEARALVRKLNEGSRHYV